MAFSPPCPARFSHKILPQEFPARISHKNFPQDFPTRFSHKHFPQTFPANISCKIFPQYFPELDPDWLAPHHSIPNAKFPPITAFLKLAFSPPPCPARFTHKNFLQDFPTRISCKIFPQTFPANISHKNFPQTFPAIFSRKIFPQYFPELDPDWLAPHHPIPNAKFPPITAFLKLAFSPPPCPARFSHKIFLQEFPTRFSHKIFRQTFPTNMQTFPMRFSHNIFPQEFLAKFSNKIFPSWILIDWLPITLFQMLNFHQSLPC